jgi:membrane protease YdiL (CAAX protease family)
MNETPRYLESAALVLIWMLAGWVFGLDAYVYLLLGVPLVALFQLVVRRQDLQRLWARYALNFRLDLPGVLIAVALMVVPGRFLIVEALPSRQWPIILWVVCCLAGAVFAAFALRQQSWLAARQALPAIAMVIWCGCIIMAAAAIKNHRSPIIGPAGVISMFKSFALFFPVCFVLEEVAFRGAIDAHLFQPSVEAPKPSAWISALFSSFLWGIWHLPIVTIPHGTPVVVVVLSVAVVHTTVGVPLSICWRRGGTLVLPAAAHAFIDAYRDAVLH